MSMVNNAHAGSSLVLLNLIDRVLIRRGKPVARSELLEILRPDLLPKSENGAKRFEWNLDFWLEEGLWPQDGLGQISAPAGATEQNIAHRVLALLVDNLNSQSEQEILDGTRSEPFFRAMTCLLAQRRYVFMGGGTVSVSNVAEAVNSWLSGRGMNESNERSTFLAYGEFLGFLEPFDKGYIVDPTLAIEPYLEKVFVDSSPLPIRVFIERLAEYLPMLDGGRYRLLLEPLMESWQPDDTYEISAALSHALVRLESAFRLRLEKASDDSASMRLQLPNGVLRLVGEIHYRAEVSI